MKTIIRNACLVNEDKIVNSDVLLSDNRIERIDNAISLKHDINYKEINGEGLYLFPGVIDDQVHFREPGLTHKATIFSESKAAVAGGTTSYMEMPNTSPNTTTIDLLEEKYQMASQSSLANYSFFLGINEHNLDEALKIENERVCGLSDDGLYFSSDRGIMANYPEFLEKLFSRTGSLVALHCEDDAIINNNTAHYRNIYGNDIPAKFHPLIRSHEACFDATKRVVDIASKYDTRLHVLHVSTSDEIQLFDYRTPVDKKRITAEACVHHLFFNEKDYDKLGMMIKWNPAIKMENDQLELINALKENKLDIIATDHAPHTFEEKSGDYFHAHSGGPLIQHGLIAMLELYHQGQLSLAKIVEKMSHHVAEVYKIKERGYIREGYYADLVLVDLQNEWQVRKENILYKCGWSPLENYSFKSKILQTFVNGKLVYDNGLIDDRQKGMRLQFSKTR